MTRNYTAVKMYLLSLKDKGGELNAINETRSETWRAGYSTQELEKKYSRESGEYRRIKEEIAGKISRIGDKRQQYILTQHYLRFKSGADIERMTGWSEKFIRNMHQRALMNMEIILLDDKILTFVDPKADMMADYEDGYKKGYEEGRSAGYNSGYEKGYGKGYQMGKEGLPFDAEEDEYEDDEDDYGEDYDDEDYDDDDWDYDEDEDD